MSQQMDVTPQEAHRLMSATPGMIYVDVRSSYEYEQGHVPGSYNVPLAEVDPTGRLAANPDFLAAVRKLFPADCPLIVGCASGGRSRQAQMLLHGAGYSSVLNMQGGFNGQRGAFGAHPGWAELGLPVATDGTAWSKVRKDAGLA